MRTTVKLAALSFLLTGVLSCAHSNHMSAKPFAGDSIAQEVRNNIAADGIRGLYIDVRGGVVTLSGTATSVAERDKAIHDAQKVRGVSVVVNRISLR